MPSDASVALWLAELDQLTPDGVSIDTLLPRFPLEKAMAGGLHIEYHKPVYPGDWLTATRTQRNPDLLRGRHGNHQRRRGSGDQ